MSEVCLLVLWFWGFLVEVRLIAGSSDEVNIYIFDLLGGAKPPALARGYGGRAIRCCFHEVLGSWLAVAPGEAVHYSSPGIPRRSSEKNYLIRKSRNAGNSYIRFPNFLFS